VEGESSFLGFEDLEGLNEEEVCGSTVSCIESDALIMVVHGC